ncbi:MAG: HAMP domain-containing sensor histidine kinase [Prevotella sp.]|nr:HAMP domain-containing sensor histidine kinase [Prevotella sp.]
MVKAIASLFTATIQLPLWLVLLTAGLLLMLAGRAYMLYRRNRLNVSKVRFLFDAIDNGDYTFHFSEDAKKDSDAALNSLLNRTKSVLQHARDEQKEREKYFELILDAVDTGILVVETQRGIVLRFNRAALQLLQRSDVSYISQVEKQLSAFSVRETHTMLRGKQVRIIGFNDIRGELANKETESWVKLIRVLTHEIMNTLTPIISLSQTLLPKAKGEEREGLEVIHRTSSELIGFVENYRKFTHLPQPQPKIFYAKPFLERMIKLSGRHVDLSVEPAGLLVYTDEGLLSRVVTNLLKNAMQATPDDGRLLIRAYTGESDKIIIEIADNGSKIDAETAEHIFVPFFTTKQDGSGIGLSISRQIMHLLGGTIELLPYDSHGLTTFRLTLN